jgi:hypothetical protein
MPQSAPSHDWLLLRLSEVEKAFVQVAIDLKEILVLDGIDQHIDPRGFRIRAHDIFGPLPDIIIKDTGDRYPVLERISNEAAKLIAIVRIRNDLAGIFPRCKFLLPTSTGNGALVGMRFGGRTILAEEKSYWEAYHRLMLEAVGKIL